MWCKIWMYAHMCIHVLVLYLKTSYITRFWHLSFWGMAIPCYRPTGQVPRAAAHRRPRGSGRRVGERLLEGAGPLDRLENQGVLI